MEFKPRNYPSVAPYLVVHDAGATIAFLENVFGAQSLRCYPGDNGKIGHAEVRIDDTVVMLGDAMEGWPAVPCHVHVYVPDVDATYRKAIEAGAVSVKEPMQGQDSDRRGGFRDAGGTTWWVGTQVGPASGAQE